MTSSAGSSVKLNNKKFPTPCLLVRKAAMASGLLTIRDVGDDRKDEKLCSGEYDGSMTPEISFKEVSSVSSSGAGAGAAGDNGDAALSTVSTEEVSSSALLKDAAAARGGLLVAGSRVEIEGEVGLLGRSCRGAISFSSSQRPVSVYVSESSSGNGRDAARI